MAKRQYICDSSHPSHPLLLKVVAPRPIRTRQFVWPSGMSASAPTTLITLEGYLTGVVSALSLVLRTNTASSFAGTVLLALRLIECSAFGGSDQLSPAR
jgi:hypothetical protein